MDDIKVSIIVPVYNLEKYLTESLESIQKQTYPNWECIIVNDGSTDGSQIIIDKFCAIDSRFRSFCKTNEKSADLARKFGIQYATADFIQHIDGDDVVCPDFIKTLVSRQLETDADCVVGHFVGCSEDFSKVIYDIPGKEFDYNSLITGEEACLNTIGGWQLSGNGMIYKKTLLASVKHGPYMNSDEFSQRQILMAAEHVAFANTNYYYRGNDGTSVKFSYRIFDRALVDRQLESFVFENFPQNVEKQKAIVSQRVFNLVYLCADYVSHKKDLAAQDVKNVYDLLKNCFKTLDRKHVKAALPKHSMVIGHWWPWFLYFSTVYVSYKRSHGGSYWYK